MAPRIPTEYREVDQHEKSYQCQDAVFVARKRQVGAAAKKQKSIRFVKNPGLGIKIPDSAYSNYVDKKCPFAGNVSIRGKILKGQVISAKKMKNTIIVRRDYLHYITKYRRFEKRHKNIAAHCSPAFEVKEGDVVTIGQCRPLAKTVTFNVVAHEPAVNAATGKKSFRVF